MLSRKTPLRRSALKRSTPIKKVGRVTRARAERKAQWIRDYPPDDEGNYLCVLCPYQVHVSVMKLEHKLPKGSTPAAIADADENLGPSHDDCNTKKGSKRIPWLNPSPSSNGKV